MDRITQKDLEALASVINDLTGSPMTSHTETTEGLKFNVGHYLLDYLDGGVSLQRTTTGFGATEFVSAGGYTMKKELYHWMSGFIAGIKL